MCTYQLPFRDDLGFCNILLSALGGDGANMAAKLLFKLGCEEMGLDGGYDARYGSEKKGTPTDVSVRFCPVGTQVRQSGPTHMPHFLAAFHDDLIRPFELNRGLQENALCIVNSHHAPEKVQQDLQLHSGRILCVDADMIAVTAGSRPNMPMLAVLAHELGFPDELIKARIAKQWPRVADRNLEAFDKAVQSVKSAEFHPDRYELLPPIVTRGQIGWRNMLNGGTIDALTHNTHGRDNRLAGRGRIPQFLPDSCTSCGICLTVCSDPGGLLWQKGRMVGIDDRFCKGCMRCVEVCPETKKGKALVWEENGA
jgi:pyruvate ferredoxin oxidoreductase gamma subunit